MGKHLIHCKQIPANLSNDEIKLKGIESYVYENFLIDLANDYENNSSLPELRKKYNIDYKNIIWLLKYKCLLIVCKDKKNIDTWCLF